MKKIKILIVDDDPKLRRTLFDILKANGYEVTAVLTGEEAIAATKKGISPWC